MAYDPCNGGATPDHFALWERQARAMEERTLLWTIADCRQAEAAMRGWNPGREGFYADQACTFGMELTRRRRAR